MAFNIKGIMNVITSFTKQHSPEILIGLGIAGMATSTVLAVKATPKALNKIEDAIEDTNEKLMDEAVAKKQDNYTPIDRLKPIEVVKLCWKDYLPATVTGVASIVCIVGGTNINLRRNAALVTAVKLSEVTVKDLQEYKKKVVETIGVEKNDEIESELDKKKVENAFKEVDGELISNMFVSGMGPILYYDKIGGQWFRSDKESIREAINRLNHTMMSDMYVTLNDLYDELGMPHTVAGDEIGWNIDDGLIEARFSSQLTPVGEAVVVMSTRLNPSTYYDKRL